MLQRFRQAGLIWPTIFMIVGLVILLSLGNWQWQRMHWKIGLIDAIAERMKRPAVNLETLFKTTSQRSSEYRWVEVKGRLAPEKVRWLYANGPEGSGWHAFVPLRTEIKGWPIEAIWINLGYVPYTERSQVESGLATRTSEIEVRGLLRRPERPSAFHSWIIGSNDHENNIYYTRSTFDMARGAYSGQAPKFMANYIDAERSGEGWPRGGTTNVKLTNKHLGYALTWWGLALTLIGVYLTFAWQRLRGSEGAS